MVGQPHPLPPTAASTLGWGARLTRQRPNSGTADPVSPASDPIRTSIFPLWTGFHMSALLHPYLHRTSTASLSGHRLTRSFGSSANCTHASHPLQGGLWPDGMAQVSCAPGTGWRSLPAKTGH